MTKDFKTSTVTQPNIAQYGMSWMFGGIAIGLIVGLFVYIVINKDIEAVPNTAEVRTDTNAMQTNASQETPLMQGNTPHTSTSQEDTLAQPNFSYHAVLPQLDVPVAITPDTTKPAKQLTNADAKAKDAATTPATTTKLGKFNAFQVGSYKTQAQATAMQARLKQNGLATHVEKAEVNGQDYFRIKLGPATSAEVYNKWQQTLSSMGINPLPIHL